MCLDKKKRVRIGGDCCSGKEGRINFSAFFRDVVVIFCFLFKEFVAEHGALAGRHFGRAPFGECPSAKADLWRLGLLFPFGLLEP